MTKAQSGFRPDLYTENATKSLLSGIYDASSLITDSFFTLVKKKLYDEQQDFVKESHIVLN